ncbi:MAG TPA: 50S ribosomal protein L10 [Dehalococcoidia bacterium]|nr:50S ribosomal protein L10 [Dehalococcoidia bacterium]
MLRDKKAEVVDRLQELLSRSTIALLTDYRGLNTAQLSQLRRHLGKHGIEYHVVKNTLTRLAAQKAGREALVPLLEGPTAIAFGFDEATTAARTLAEYIRSARLGLTVKGGLFYHQVLTPREVSILATAPPREVLIAQFLRQLNNPLQSLANVLAANLGRLVTILQSRIQQLEGG